MSKDRLDQAKPEDVARWAQAYGRDPERWPAVIDANGLSDASDNTALRQARELDEVLGLVATPSAQDDVKAATLSASIVAKVANLSAPDVGSDDVRDASSRPKERSNNVIAFPSAKPTTASRPADRRSMRELPAAALLAACLVLGVALGTVPQFSGLAGQFASGLGVFQTAQVAGLDTFIGDASDDDLL